MSAIIEENRVIVDIKNEQEVINTANIIINMLKEQEIVEKISEYNEEVEGFQLLLGYKEQGEFKEWSMEDIGMELDLEHYDEDITESYLTYLFALGAVEGGKDKLIEIIDTILADENLREMYENEFIYIHETPMYALAKLYPEYKYYLGRIVNEIPLSSMDHWYLELGRETILKMDRKTDSIKLFASLFASPCFVEIFEDEYEELGESIVEALLEDDEKYQLFCKTLKARVDKNNQQDKFLAERKEFLDEAELDINNTAELVRKLEVDKVFE